MNKRNIILALICLIFVFQGLSCSQNAETTIKANQGTNIPITPGAGEFIASGIMLKNVTAMTITATQTGFNPGGEIQVNPGDICQEIIGIFSNTTDNDLQISYYADGYDASGHQISWTLDSGPIQGIKALDISKHSDNSFAIRISWAEAITLIKLVATSYAGGTPVP
jgi:hypothetical protein